MRRPATLLALAAALGIACAPSGPRAIAYDAESCGYCRMTISDPRFGAELVSSTGKTHTFDSIECLASYAAEHADARGSVARAMWVSDYAHPGTFLPVDSAEFRRLTGPAGSPMGKGLVATRRGAPVSGALASAGPVLQWMDVLVLARREAQHAPDVAEAR
jgi:copper chaperone NosL